MTLLKKGSVGDEVRKLQQMLNLKVPSIPLLAVDGIFGVKTEARVKTFQTANQLKVDGIVGDKTIKALVTTVIAQALSASR